VLYLLINNETDGPHNSGEVQDWLDAKEIDVGCLAAVAGMKEWRAVEEALVWARGKLLADIREVVQKQVVMLKDGNIGIAQARTLVTNTVPLQKRLRDPKAAESFGNIIQTNADLMRNYERFDDENHAVRLADYPCLELYELSKPSFVRDWRAAWRSAGGEVYSERMIARKDSTVWLALNDFGYPFPPFSFDRSMWTRDIDREQCMALGAIGNDEIPHKPIVSKVFDLVGIPHFPS
jgi:hypothetical protein